MKQQNTNNKPTIEQLENEYELAKSVLKYLETNNLNVISLPNIKHDVEQKYKKLSYAHLSYPKTVNKDDFTRVNNNEDGNPRFVLHFPAFIGKGEELSYELALKRAKKFHGRKFHNKQYGGGIVFTELPEYLAPKINEYLETLARSESEVKAHQIVDNLLTDKSLLFDFKTELHYFIITGSDRGKLILYRNGEILREIERSEAVNMIKAKV